jgi:hypothetical protein
MMRGILAFVAPRRSISEQISTRWTQVILPGYSQATPEMSQLYSTVGQREIQRAVGKVISISGYRELTLSGDPEYAGPKWHLRASA